MATESLYTSQTPDVGSTDLADLGSGGITAGAIQFASAGSVSAGRFYAPATVSGASTFVATLWEITAGEGSTSGSGTGTLLASKSVAGTAVTAAAWNTIVYDTPVSVTTGKVYRTQVYNSAGRYVARSGTFTSGSVVNGNLTGPQSGTVSVGGAVVRNGTYRASATSGQYASDYFGAPSYLVDVVYEAAPSTVDGTLAASLPALVGAFAGDIRTDGVLVGALPALAAVAAGDIRDDGTLAATLPGLRAALRDITTVEPGTLTADGRAMSTLTPGGRP